MNPLRVTGLDHIVLTVADARRSLAWYGALGLEPHGRRGNDHLSVAGRGESRSRRRARRRIVGGEGGEAREHAQ